LKCGVTALGGGRQSVVTYGTPRSQSITNHILGGRAPVTERKERHPGAGLRYSLRSCGSIAAVMSGVLAKASSLKPEIRLAQAVSEFEADLSNKQKSTFRTLR
jgi:hypothetical protein